MRSSELISINSLHSLESFARLVSMLARPATAKNNRINQSEDTAAAETLQGEYFFGKPRKKSRPMVGEENSKYCKAFIDWGQFRKRE